MVLASVLQIQDARPLYCAQIVKEGTAGYLGTWKSDPPPAAEKNQEEEVTMLDELGMFPPSQYFSMGHANC